MNLSVRTKLMVGFALVLIALVIVGWRGVAGMGQVDEMMNRLVKQEVASAIKMGEANQLLIKRNRAVVNHILDPDPSEMRERERHITQYGQQMLARLQEVSMLSGLPEEAKQKISEIIQLDAQSNPVRERIVKLSRASTDNEARALERNELRPMVDQIDAKMEDLVASTRSRLTAAVKSAGETYARTRMVVFGVIGIALIASFCIAFFLSNAIVKAVNEIVRVASRVVEGDLTARIHNTSRDELGKIGEALNHAFERTSQAIQEIGQNSHALAGSSEELTAVSQQMGANAEETSSQATTVSAAAEQVSRNVQTVATAAEEMNASIREIAKNASEAARVATSAVGVAETTNATVSRLGESSAEIGNVIKVITSIAEQTNLLALNATIEAARAGEAGKGFAVVANEVKELARETARATEEIGEKVATIQTTTTGAVAAITEIGTIIDQINDISNTIASAVEEQAATSNEIGRNVGEAARASSEIAENIAAVAQAAQSTSAGAIQTQTEASELARMAVSLQRLVAQFKYEERVAITQTADLGRFGRPVVGGQRSPAGDVVLDERQPQTNGHARVEAGTYR